MKGIGWIVLAVIGASVLGGSGERFAPPFAAAADSVQKATAIDSLPPVEWSAATADSVQRAVAMMNGFMCDSHLSGAFLKLIHEDKVARAKTRKDSPAWLNAKRNPRAYLTGEGVRVPEEITVTFLYSIPGTSQYGIYCIEACIGPRGRHCASCAHPEKTGCFMVRQCYPMISM